MAQQQSDPARVSAAQGADATVTNSRGAVIHFDPQDARGRSLAEGVGEPYPNSLALWELALRLRDDWDVVLDIGANYGEMLAGVELPDTRVVAFEPNSHVLPYLRRTLDALPTKVELVERAVGDVSIAEAAFEADLEWSGRAHMAAVSAVDEASARDLLTVELTTLDEFFPRPPRAVCMKIDVEGFELQVLRGAQKLFDGSQFVAVMLEILHLPVQDVLELSRRHPLYLLDIKRRELVRYTGRDGYELGRALHAGDLYRQDALLLAGAAVESFDESVRGPLEDTLARELRATADRRDQLAKIDGVRRALRAFRDSIGQDQR